MLELKDISYSVKDEVTGKPQDILKNIDLTFDDAASSVITGPNGSGKSTLIKILMGFEKPTSGQILFNGEDITALGVTERARKGFTIAFQQPVRFKGITVKRLLEYACGKKLDTDGMCECLSAVGLCARNYIDRSVDGTLSGGELKRIELAMAIAKGGEVFLLDEPEAGIDLWSFDRLTQTFEQLYKQENGKSIIIISHQERIIELADEIICLRAGKIESQGSVEEILPQLGLSAKGNSYCSFTEPPDLHLTEISTTC